MGRLWVGCGATLTASLQSDFDLLGLGPNNLTMWFWTMINSDNYFYTGPHRPTMKSCNNTTPKSCFPRTFNHIKQAEPIMHDKSWSGRFGAETQERVMDGLYQLHFVDGGLLSSFGTLGPCGGGYGRGAGRGAGAGIFAVSSRP